ncbi:MAG: Hsp33 family molecular chaperone HslO [Acidobacteria bacterium]|nr:Hsp33 family molecular chaperone HslO [Acidobacteriota bacterium]MCB9378038.1 Hsp33 family molecular chaperone HslO [Holophagales bacterium]
MESEGKLELGVAGGTSLRWAAVDLTGAVEEARRRHDLSPIAAAALGRALAGATLLLNLSARSCSRLTITVVGDGPLGRVIAEADQQGNLRGLVGEPHVDLPAGPEGKLAVGAAIGEGSLRVHRELADGSSYESQVELVSGELGLDLAHFLEQSEQTPSAVLVGVLAGPEGIRAAGGMIVEVMPDAGEEAVDRLERNLADVGGFSRALETSGVDGVIDTILASLDRQVLETNGVRFRCRCARETLLDRLTVLSEEEKVELADLEGRIEAECAFCAAHYLYHLSELETQ